jgi:hypothetical protein
MVSVQANFTASSSDSGGGKNTSLNSIEVIVIYVVVVCAIILIVFGFLRWACGSCGNRATQQPRNQPAQAYAVQVPPLEHVHVVATPPASAPPVSHRPQVATASAVQ